MAGNPFVRKPVEHALIIADLIRIADARAAEIEAEISDLEEKMGKT